MTSSSERIHFSLGRLVQKSIVDLNYKISDDQNHPNRLRAIKDRVLDGPVDIDIFAQNRFRAVISGAHFNEGLRRDFYFGSNRVNKLLTAVTKLDSSGSATAWILTTSYYSTYFAGLELLRSMGTLISYFNSSDIDRIAQRAKTVIATPEIGTYEGRAAYDSITNEIRIEYTKTASGYHHFVWVKLNQKIAQAIKLVGQSDNFSQNLTAVVDGSWPSISDTRNMWNYQNVCLFGEMGEKTGSEFRKLARDRISAIKWAGKKQALHDSSQASSVALLKALILNVFDTTKEKVLSPQLLKLVR